MLQPAVRALSLRSRVVASLTTFLLASACPYIAVAQEDLDTEALLNLSLKELSEIEVTSVSKRAEQADEAAAAIFVITQEDIRRSGATDIPEVLRMAPGITVTRATSNDWTVTARGSNDQFSNKLLVLMDGRTIYSPLFSGVIWDVQDTMLEDIDRIEVIRGPGATLWGANAVNGVINIITKKASETQGGYAMAAAGNQLKGMGAVRYGGKIGEDSYVRMYAKQTEYNSEKLPSGITANDNWERSQAGFRSDSRLTENDTLNVQGDIYTIDEDVNYTIPDLNAGPTFYIGAEGRKSHGFNILSRWEHKLNKDSETSLQAYIDNTFRKTSFFNDETTTADIDFQHVWTGWQGHEIVWGTGYRFINSENDPTSQQYALSPQTRSDNLFNAFIQDKITLNPNDVFLTLGSKFEHNDYTGVEIQPSARLTWLPADNQTVWASVSRAVHTPYRYTDDITQLVAIDPNGGFPILFTLTPAPFLKSEELIAYELGYRIQPTKSLSFDLAAFYNDYDNLFYSYLGDFTIPGGYVLQPIVADNSDSAKSLGAELATKWNITNQWQMAGAYSYLSQDFAKKASVGQSFVGKTPKHQFNIRSTYMFPRNIEMTNALYFVDDLTSIGIDGYHRFDTRLSYEVQEGIELSLIGHNLFDARHQEFSALLYGQPVEIGRSFYGSIGVKF